MKTLVTRNFGKPLTKAEAGRLGGKASAKARKERAGRAMSLKQKARAVKAFVKGAGGGQMMARSKAGKSIAKASPALRSLRAMKKKVHASMKGMKARVAALRSK